MRLFVKIYGADGRECGTYVIPCKDGIVRSVGNLKEEILTRHKHKENSSNYELSVSGNGAALCEQDNVGDVLENGDYITLKPKNVPQILTRVETTGSLPSYEFSLFQALSSSIKKAEWIELDGKSLTIENLIKIGSGELRVKLSSSAIEAVKSSRKVIDDIVDEHRVVYGITTGFGKFARVFIPKEKLVELQECLIRSHAAGVGPPLSPQQTRRLLALRINVLSKGCSGIRPETLQKLIDALNESCLPYIPEQGTVGASGDLAPLSHLALGLMGEGRMWSPRCGWGDAKEILEAHSLKPISLQPKEGLALINGTQFVVSIGSEALFRAEQMAKQADVIAALSIDALQGTPRAFDADLHANRPHPGQQLVASRLRALLDSNIHPSEIRESHKNCDRVQDAYTMRCVPQIHGIVNDTIGFVRGILTTEINSATDNPMILAERQESISGGNFHGEYPAKVLDYLAIGVHELANVSERRLERLVHPAYSGLPAFLVNDGGLNNGFMIAHCTSAALVSENKVLTHPSSVDSISTSAGTEDHVSMGGFSARKALQVVKHVEQVLAIELLAACQAMEFHRPKKTTAPLEEVYKLVRSVVRPWDKDRFMAPDIEAVTKLLVDGEVWRVAKPYIDQYQVQQSKKSQKPE